MYIDDNARMLPVLEACTAAVPRDSREHLRGRQNLACLFYSLEHRAHHRHVVADLSRELGRYVGWSFKNKKKNGTHVCTINVTIPVLKGIGDGQALHSRGLCKSS